MLVIHLNLKTKLTAGEAHLSYSSALLPFFIPPLIERRFQLTFYNNQKSNTLSHLDIEFRVYRRS